MGRLCAVCLKVIHNHGPLCGDCMTLYGGKRCQWPVEIRLLVKLYEKEHNYERNHPHNSLEAVVENHKESSVVNLMPDFYKPKSQTR